MSVNQRTLQFLSDQLCGNFILLMHDAGCGIAGTYTEDVLSPHLFPLITQTSHLVAKWCEINYAQFACGGKYGNYCELLRRYQISVIYLRQNDSFIPSEMHASLEKGTPLCTHGESSTPVYKGKKKSVEINLLPSQQHAICHVRTKLKTL